jgi:serine/threonine protein kinase
MIFIWNRIIEAMTFAHLSGVVHCAITPNHVLIHAEKHMGQIIDWTASCRLGCGDNVPYADSRYSSFFPDEIIDPQGVPSPASDIFMSAWCMVYILGGDPKKKIGPQNVERPIIELLNRCLQPQRRHRPQTAEALYHDFREVTMGLFGPRKFIEFAMPRGMANA